MRGPKWLPAAALAGICFVVAIGLEQRESASDGETAQTAASPADPREVLGDLEVGDNVVGWTVLGIRSNPERVIDVDLGRDRIRFTVTVAPLGTRVESAPLTTDHYALYYGHAHPKGAKLPDAGVQAVLHNLARAIEGER